MIAASKTQRSVAWFFNGSRIRVWRIQRLAILAVILFAFVGNAQAARSAKTNQDPSVKEGADPASHAPLITPKETPTPHPTATPHLTPTPTPHPTATPHVTPTPTPHPTATPHVTPTPHP